MYTYTNDFLTHVCQFDYIIIYIYIDDSLDILLIPSISGDITPTTMVKYSPLIV